MAMHLSIVIPVFNSSNILNNLIKQIKFNLKLNKKHSNCSIIEELNVEYIFLDHRN